MINKRKGISLKISINMLLTALLLVAIYTVLYKASMKNAKTIGVLNAEKAGTTVDLFFTRCIDEIESVSNKVQEMIVREEPYQTYKIFFTKETEVLKTSISENYVACYGYINGTYVTGVEWTPPSDFNPVERPWYKDAKKAEGKVALVSPYKDLMTGNLMMSVAKLLPDGESVVVTDIYLTEIQNYITNLKLKDYTAAFLVDHVGKIVAHSNSDENGKSYLFEPETFYGRLIREVFNKPSVFRFSFKGEKYHVFTKQLNGEWYSVLVMKDVRLFRSFRFLAYMIFLAVFIIGLVFTILYLNINQRRNAAEELNDQLDAIANIYLCVYTADLVQQKFNEIRAVYSISKIFSCAEGFTIEEMLKDAMHGITKEQSWELMEDFLNFSTLDERMAETSTITLEFVGFLGWARARFIALAKDSNNKITEIMFLIENIEEDKKKQNELRYLSETDLMTGIKNRGCGEKKVKELINIGKHGMFCVMDVDSFKSINDTYGHITGDNVIKEVAQCMQNSFRDSDIILRLGGDEFAAFAVGIKTKEAGMTVLKRFVDELDHISIKGISDKRKICMSIGVSFFDENNVVTFDQLYHQADVSSYKSKQLKGSCSNITFFEE